MNDLRAAMSELWNEEKAKARASRGRPLLAFLLSCSPAQEPRVAFL